MNSIMIWNYFPLRFQSVELWQQVEMVAIELYVINSRIWYFASWFNKLIVIVNMITSEIREILRPVFKKQESDRPEVYTTSK